MLLEEIEKVAIKENCSLIHTDSVWCFRGLAEKSLQKLFEKETEIV